MTSTLQTGGHCSCCRYQPAPIRQQPSSRRPLALYDGVEVVRSGRVMAISPQSGLVTVHFPEGGYFETFGPSGESLVVGSLTQLTY